MKIKLLSLLLLSLIGCDNSNNDNNQTIEIPSDLPPSAKKTINGTIEIHSDSPLNLRPPSPPKFELVFNLSEGGLGFSGPYSIEEEAIYDHTTKDSEGNAIFIYKYQITTQAYRLDRDSTEEAIVKSQVDFLICSADGAVSAFQNPTPIGVTRGLIDIAFCFYKAKKPDENATFEKFTLDLSQSAVFASYNSQGETRFSNTVDLEGRNLEILQTEEEIINNSSEGTLPPLIINLSQGPGSSGGGQTDGGTP